MVDKNEEEKYGYPKEKIDIIKSSSMEELMQLLDEISVSSARSAINKNVLSKFIDSKYKNEKDNLKKFGKETKENYCKALRGELEGFFGTNKKQQIKSPQEVALSIFSGVIFMWCVSNAEIDKLGIFVKESNGKVIYDYEKLTEMLIKAKGKISKETLSTFYKFAPISKNKNIEKEIDNAPYRLELLNREHEKDDNDEKLEKLNKRVEELDAELKDTKQELEKYSDYDNIKKQLEEKEERLKQYIDYQKIKDERESLKTELDNKNKELSQYSSYNEIKEQADQYVELKNEYDELKREKDEIEREKNALENDFEDLEKLFDNDNNEQIQELRKKYEELKKDHNELMHKKTPSGDLEKAKENFKKQINEKNEEIEVLKKKINDLEEQIETNKSISNKKVVVDNSDLTNFDKFIKENLKSKILKDKEFRENFKRFVLADEALCEFIIKKFPKLKEAVVLEVANRIDQRNIDKELKIDASSPILVDKYNSIVEPQEYRNDTETSILSNDYDNEEEYFRYPSRLKLLSQENEEQFKQEFFLLIEGQDEYKNDLYNKMQKDFVILNNNKELKCWLKAQHYDFEPLVVVPQLDWISYKDWFGHFEDDKFIREATLASDYYKFLENNSTIPLGIIVFQDFNNAIPAYIEPFITELITNKEVRLGHKSKIVNPKDETFKTIKMLPNLKFVFIKSQSDNAFNIPESMKKYEVMNV